MTTPFVVLAIVMTMLVGACGCVCVVPGPIIVTKNYGEKPVKKLKRKKIALSRVRRVYL